jgi:hypothetical protein
MLQSHMTSQTTYLGRGSWAECEIVGRDFTCLLPLRLSHLGAVCGALCGGGYRWPNFHPVPPGIVCAVLSCHCCAVLCLCFRRPTNTTLALLQSRHLPGSGQQETAERLGRRRAGQ